jgi:hypothetical protein
MNKVILHIGDYYIIENRAGTLGVDLEVAGNICLSPKSMSAVGNNLRPHDGEWELLGDRHVFTNNDHVLNGLRLALRQGYLLAEQVQVFFHESNAPVVEIKFSQQGRSSNWPEGFMDQIENDLAKL